jgi:transcriptional regulator with XRE-family HTH domain
MIERMSEQNPADHADLAGKIARLVEEKGWNQEEFAKIARLNRQTVRQILLSPGERSLRNSTVAACAKALGLSVLELRSQPLERLLPRVRGGSAADGDEKTRRLYELATQPELRSWMERNPERSKQLTDDEIDELLVLQGTGGPLTAFGVESFVAHLERRRSLVQQVKEIAGTEYIDLLEQLVQLMHDKIQPYRDRV